MVAPVWSERAHHRSPCDARVSMCDRVICSVLYTLLVFSGVRIPPYPQFTAPAGSRCPVEAVYLRTLNSHPPPTRPPSPLHSVSLWLSPSSRCLLHFWSTVMTSVPLTSCSPLSWLISLFALVWLTWLHTFPLLPPVCDVFNKGTHQKMIIFFLLCRNKLHLLSVDEQFLLFISRSVPRLKPVRSVQSRQKKFKWRLQPCVMYQWLSCLVGKHGDTQVCSILTSILLLKYYLNTY